MEMVSSPVEDLLRTYSAPSLIPKDGVVLTFFYLPFQIGTTHIFLFWEKIGKKLGRKNINENVVIYSYTIKMEVV
jgi:hypothetical protein